VEVDFRVIIFKEKVFVCTFVGPNPPLENDVNFASYITQIEHDV